MFGTTRMSELEELIHALEMGKPDYDGEDVNYNVATIEDAITIIKKYAEIVHKVEEFHRKTTPKKHIETAIELQMSLKELEAHTMCLANQVRDIVGEVDWYE